MNQGRLEIDLLADTTKGGNTKLESNINKENDYIINVQNNIKINQCDSLIESIIGFSQYLKKSKDTDVNYE